MATQLPWFPFYVDDYLHDTYDLSPCEHGVYLLLLSRFWISGPLRDDLDVLCRMAAGAQPQMVREILERFWTLTGQGWVNARMKAEMAKSLDTRKKRAEAANSMWKKKLGKSTEAPMQEHMPGICYPQPQSQSQSQEDTHPTDESPKLAKASHERATSPCPYQKIREMWIEALPELTKPASVEHWTPARKAQLRARWADQLPDMEAWEDCFSAIRRSKFLMGQSSPPNGRKPFRADLFWITKPENLLKLAEGKYDG